MTTDEANTHATLERIIQLRRANVELAAVDRQLKANAEYADGTISATNWLLAWLTTHGPQPKRAVVQAWLGYKRSKRAFRANWRNTLEVAFARAKRRGLLTSHVSGWQGDAIWRMLELGKRSNVIPRRTRQARSVLRDGRYRPSWGAPKRANLRFPTA